MADRSIVDIAGLYSMSMGTTFTLILVVALGIAFRAVYFGNIRKP